MDELPIIDVTALVDGGPDGAGRAEDPGGLEGDHGRGGDEAVMAVAEHIDSACRRNGFFMVTGHGIDPSMQGRLDRAAREFFALPDEVKDEVAMRHGGRTWRGWFPLGGELTSGRPDHKEGYYFGTELPADDPRVGGGLPLHGANLFPTEPLDLRPAVLGWIAAMTELAHRLMEGIALGLGLDRGWFQRELTTDPTVLFRIFHYPPATAAPTAPPPVYEGGATTPERPGDHTDADTAPPTTPPGHRGGATPPRCADDASDNERGDSQHGDGGEGGDEGGGVAGSGRWGVAEHTDYGLLTILAQDGSGGLQVRSGDGWIDVPPVPGAFVCNIGDMLDRMTGGRYRSTPHRVLATDADRLSFPFFFDPSWDAVVAPLPLDGEPPTDDALTRWDATSVHEHQGTYGDYLTAKVSKVFPDLAEATD